MDDQVTFRLPTDIARALSRLARERGVPKSRLVREALQTYLAGPPAGAGAIPASRRIAPFVGAVSLDPAGDERDDLARRIRAHNWR